jgi:hypothetical protein
LIKWGEAGAKPNDKYAVQLNNIMHSFPIFADWPPTISILEDFEKLGITEEEALLQDKYIESISAFQRIRAYGYSYQINP